MNNRYCLILFVPCLLQASCQYGGISVIRPTGPLPPPLVIELASNVQTNGNFNALDAWEIDYSYFYGPNSSGQDDALRISTQLTLLQEYRRFRLFLYFLGEDGRVLETQELYAVRPGFDSMTHTETFKSPEGTVAISFMGAGIHALGAAGTATTRPRQ